MAQTPILNIPYPDEEQEEFYNSFVSMMREVERITLMNKIQNALVLGGGGTVSFNSGTGALTWTADFILPVLHYGKKVTIQYGPNFATRQATLSDGSGLYIELPYTMNSDMTTSLLFTNQLDRLNHQQCLLALRIGSKVHIKGMSPIG